MAGAMGAAGAAGAGGATGASGAPAGTGGAAPTGGDRWGAVKTALTQFLNAPAAAGLNVGIQYFGLGSSGFLGGLQSSCNYQDYQTAEVEIGELPGNSQNIINSLNRHGPSTNTPTTPALQGAINHAIDWKNMHPGHAVVVLLITDGQPNGCGAIADVVQVAQQGVMRTIPTYVIGVTSPGTTCSIDANPPNQQDLDAVATAGGTGQALLVDLSKDVVQQFLDTMDKIRDRSTIPCQYAVPPPPMGEKLDPMKVNVEYTAPGAMMPTTLGYVTSTTCSPTTGGWYYDDPLMPKTITLCPASCDVIKKDVSGAVNIALGCARKIAQ
jgi:von Willebrand factor type A domain